jgi:predicted secreted hydrolase
MGARSNRIDFQKVNRMSKAVMESVIGKAILETEFREALLANPERALDGFALTLAEKNSLKRMDSETMEALARALSASIHKAAGTGDQTLAAHPISPLRGE